MNEDFWNRYLGGDFGGSGIDVQPRYPVSPWRDEPPWTDPMLPPSQYDPGVNYLGGFAGDPRMVQDPHHMETPMFPDSQGSIFGEQKMYDPQSVADMVMALRGSSPESMPNPAPSEFSDPNLGYGAQMPIPGLELPPNWKDLEDMMRNMPQATPMAPGLPGDLNVAPFNDPYNPNVQPSPTPNPDMETVGQGSMFPGGAYPSYGRFQQTINDMVNGPPSAAALQPGFQFGQDVMSTDMPTWSERTYPNMGPGWYPTGEVSNQDAGSFDPNDYQPGPIPSPTPDIFAPGMPPGQSMNFGGAPDVPGSQAFPTATPYPSQIAANPFGASPTEPLTGQTNPFYQAPSSIPDTTGNPFAEAINPMFANTWKPAGFDTGAYVGIATTSIPNPDGGFWMYDQNWNYMGQSDDQNVGPAPPGSAAPGQPNQPVSGPYQTPVTGANGIIGLNPYSYGPPSSTVNNTITLGQGGTNAAGQPIIDPTTGMPVAGSVLSPSDEAKRFNMQNNIQPLPGQGGFHPGQTAARFALDAAGNLVDATGKVIRAAGQGAVDLYHNIMNDPRNTDPGYLRSIGYEPGQGTGSLFPGEVTGPTRGSLDTLLGGIEGQGGSFFHGELTQPNAIDPSTGLPRTDVGASPMNPGGYNYPVHGPTPIAGAFANLGGSGPVNLSSLGGDAYSRQLMERLRKNSYWTNGQLWSKALGPTRTFEGGSLPVNYIWGAGVHPTAPAAAGTPIQIANPAALFGGGNTNQVLRPLQQFGGRTGSGTPPVHPA